MLHTKRTFGIAKIETAEELSHKLFDSHWVLCQGFESQGLLWLNDSFSEDGAQEYAVFQAEPDESGKYRQVESITVSWIASESNLLEMIRDLVQNPSPALAHYKLRLDYSDDHRCELCM